MKTIPVLALTLLLALGAGEVRAAVDEIPYFARRYDVDCVRCHVSPPKLNEFGEAFVRNNYRMPELNAQDTWPVAVWATLRADLPPETVDLQRSVRSYVNRVELISGGEVVAPWLSYFVEWRPVSFELQGDGSLRDRSGRFEDIFLNAQFERLEVSVGQFRQIAQVDISRRLAVNEPYYYSASMTGEPHPDSRREALRGFSLSGRAPGARVGWITRREGGWEWTRYATVPFPGELSLPLTEEAREEASNELELRPKGLLLETFLRRGLTSAGAHLFYDWRGRLQGGLLGTHRTGDLLWSAAAGATGRDGSLRGRFLAEGEWIQSSFLTVGARGEARAGRDPALFGYLNAHFPGSRHTFRLTLEQRVQENHSATFLELGAVF